MSSSYCSTGSHTPLQQPQARLQGEGWFILLTFAYMINFIWIASIDVFILLSHRFPHPTTTTAEGGGGAGRGGFILLTLISVHDQSHMDSKD